MTVSAIAVILKWKYLEGLMDPEFSPEVMEKIMYFMEEAGERTPYYIVGREDSDLASLDHRKRIDCMIPVSPDRVRTAWQFLEQSPLTCIRIRRVAKLMGGFESLFGLSLLSRVHWYATRKKTIPELIGGLKYSIHHIQMAAQHLKENGWISPEMLVPKGDA